MRIGWKFSPSHKADLISWVHTLEKSFHKFYAVVKSKFIQHCQNKKRGHFEIVTQFSGIKWYTNTDSQGGLFQINTILSGFFSWRYLVFVFVFFKLPQFSGTHPDLSFSSHLQEVRSGRPNVKASSAPTYHWKSSLPLGCGKIVSQAAFSSSNILRKSKSGEILTVPCPICLNLS